MNETIMIMHKEPDTLLSIQILLEKNGYKVISVNNFEDFLEKIRGGNLDLVLVDGLMPRKQILEEIRKNGIKCVYFASDDVDEEEIKNYKNVVGKIEEQFEVEQFLEKIKRLLAGK